MSRSPDKVSELPKGTDAPLAYLLLVHRQPDQFEWLFKALYNERDLFVIHVDAKSLLGLKSDRSNVWERVRTLAGNRPNVKILRPRFTNWGGWSLTQITLDAIRYFLESNSEWRYFVNLSGQCYPLQDPTTIRHSVNSRYPEIILEMRSFAELPPDDWHLRRYRMFETPIRAHRIGTDFMPPPGLDISFKGSQWCMLPRDFCIQVLSSEVAKKVRAYARRALLSDEMFFQNVVANIGLFDRISQVSGRYVVWPGPKTLTAADLGEISESGAFFARKFDCEVDVSVLKAIAQRNEFPLGPSVAGVKRQ